jgi:hypothetical protein
MSVEKIIKYRAYVADRIDKKYGAFTEKANKLQEENLRRMREEIKRFMLKEKNKR